MWLLLSWAGCEGTADIEALPAAELQAIAEQLVSDAGAPGALLGVQRGEERWLGAAGTEDLDGAVPMLIDGVFRAGSITKMFTGALVLQEIEAGRLSLEDTLDDFEPSFPNARDITIEQLLSHTAGVTSVWLEDPELQAAVLADLSRQWTQDEVIAQMSTQTPEGAPGATGMVYSNTDFVLLGSIVSQLSGTPLPELLAERLLTPLSLAQTSYTFDTPDTLVSGHYEFSGVLLDITTLPQDAVLSFAGPAGALHSTTNDLLTFADALLRRGDLLDESSVQEMMSPALPGSWYGHATMRFCPCPDGSEDYSGWGHGGNLPGYWSVVVFYPEEDVIITAAINRDTLDGVPLDVTVFDPTLAAVLSRLAAP